MKNKQSVAANATILGIVILCLVISSCGRNDESSADNRKPILSLADLMIDFIVDSQSANDSLMLDQILKLREIDKKFYYEIYQGGSLGKDYFYSRNGSCCPCNPRISACCNCPQDAAVGAVMETVEMTVFSGVESDQMQFLLTKNSSVQQTEQREKLPLDSTIMGNVKIFKIKPGTPKDKKYEAVFKFKGEGLDGLLLSLEVFVNDKGEFTIEKPKSRK